MNFYLGVWSSENPLSEQEAAKCYRALAEGQNVPTGFRAGVYAFWSELTRHYPEIDMVGEEELDSCPWACALEVSEYHVIMALLPEKYPTILPLVLQLAEQHGLVCFDPQNTKLHLPSRLLQE